MFTEKKLGNLAVQILIRLFVFSIACSIPFAACSRATSGASSSRETTEIEGSVTDCWAGRVIPIKNLPVYIYPNDENGNIWRLVEEIRQLPPIDEPKTIREFGHLYDELVHSVQAAHAVTRHTRTNQRGQFAFRNLKADQQYLILAIDPESEQGPDYTYLITEKLKPGIYNVKLWMGVGTESDCRPPAR